MTCTQKREAARRVTNLHGQDAYLSQSFQLSYRWLCQQLAAQQHLQHPGHCDESDQHRTHACTDSRSSLSSIAGVATFFGSNAVAAMGRSRVCSSIIVLKRAERFCNVQGAVQWVQRRAEAMCCQSLMQQQAIGFANRIAAEATRLNGSSCSMNLLACFMVWRPSLEQANFMHNNYNSQEGCYLQQQPPERH